MEDLNLHFTGDVHAITAANNLLSALVDAHIFHGHSPQIANVTWRRAIDVTDRSLRSIVTGLGGPKNGIPAESGFDITAASEVMAIMALATDMKDLRKKLRTAMDNKTMTQTARLKKVSDIRDDMTEAMNRAVSAYYDEAEKKAKLN